MHKHATLTEWNRAEDGSYEAEIEGWSLTVAFEPEGETTRRGFRWRAKGPDDQELNAARLQEEIEHAMADAEDAARSRVPNSGDDPGSEDKEKKAD